MNRTKDKGTVFLLELYMEDRERVEVIGRILKSGIKDIVWAIHDQDESKAHCHVLVRVPYQMTIKAFADKYGARNRLIQLCGRDREHSNYKGAMIYLTHRDKGSVVAGKHQYTEFCLYGPWRDEAVRMMNRAKGGEGFSDNDITIILDYIQSNDYLSSSDLVRWAVNRGMYSILRRSMSVVRDCLREHNNLNRRDDSFDSISAELREIRKRLEKNERDISYQRGFRARMPDPDSRVKVDMAALDELLGRYKFNG